MELLGLAGVKKQDRRKIFETFYSAGGTGMAAKLRERRAVQAAAAVPAASAASTAGGTRARSAS
jgi:hypothetical protein